MSPERMQLFESLPETFTPADARDLAGQLHPDRPWLQGSDWIRSVLDGWLQDGVVERIRRGHYQKTEKI